MHLRCLRDPAIQCCIVFLIAVLVLDTAYTIEIQHDGKAVQCKVNGVPRSALTGLESLVRGHVFLWIHTDLQVRVSKLEITASVDDSAFQSLKQHWVATQLEKL